MKMKDPMVGHGCCLLESWREVISEGFGALPIAEEPGEKQPLMQRLLAMRGCFRSFLGHALILPLNELEYG